jgi:GAF domain-containing protein
MREPTLSGAEESRTIKDEDASSEEAILATTGQLRDWQEQIINALLVGTSILGLFAVVAEAFLVLPEGRWDLLIIIGAAYIIVLGLTVFRRIPLRIRATVFLGLFYLLGVFDLSLSGLSGDGRIFMLTFPLLALILLGRQAGLGALLLSLASLGGVGWAMAGGYLAPTFEARSVDVIPWITGVVVYLLLAVVALVPTSYVVNNLVRNLGQALTEVHHRWRDVQRLSQNLEVQVEERTEDLARRSEKLEAASRVSREAAAIRDVAQLLDETVRLISKQFEFYHAGIFLVEETGEYAVLRAASSPGGQRMLSRGHRLKVGEVGIVGYVARYGRARIALDVGADAAFFDNPDLPDTRSEMGLPLRAHGKVIGVLDVQSTREAAFTEEDVAILETMADQVALALENARLLEESQRALRELQVAYGEYSQAAWDSMESSPSFVYDRIEVAPASPEIGSGTARVLATGRTVALNEPERNRSALIAPLRLRDQVIGALTLEETDQARSWTQEEIELVETVGDQLAQALESARLYQMEQRRRQIADTLREMARVVGSTLDPAEVIDRLLDQLARLIEFQTASIQLLQEDRRELIGGRGFDVAAARERPYLQRPVSEDSLISELVQGRQPLVIPDTKIDPRWEQREDNAHARSWIGAPLVVGERVIGLLTVDHPRPNIYTRETAVMVSAVAAQAAVAVQNARFYADARRRAEEQESLARIAALAGSTIELEDLLARLAEEAHRALGAENTVLLLLDEEQQVLRGSYLSPEGKLMPLAIDWLVPLDAPGFEYSIFARGGVYYSDTGRRDPNVIPAYLPGMEALGVENFCGVALVVQERSIGEMYLINRPQGFGKDEARILRTVAGYAANAIQNAKLFEETQRRVEELDMLFGASRNLAGAPLEAEEIAAIVAREFVEVMRIPEASVSLLDPDGDTLRVLADFFRSEDGIQPEQAQEYFRLSDYPATAHVMETLEPLVVQASDPDADQAEMAYMRRQNVATLAILPLAVKGQAIGLIELEEWNEERRYTAAELNLAMTMANQAAVALENARLFQQTAQRAEQERLTAEITTKLRASASVQMILETAAHELAEALGTSRVVVRVGLEEQGLTAPETTDESPTGSDPTE